MLGMDFPALHRSIRRISYLLLLLCISPVIIPGECSMVDAAAANMALDEVQTSMPENDYSVASVGPTKAVAGAGPTTAMAGIKPVKVKIVGGWWSEVKSGWGSWGEDPWKLQNGVDLDLDFRHPTGQNVAVDLSFAIPAPGSGVIDGDAGIHLTGSLAQQFRYKSELSIQRHSSWSDIGDTAAKLSAGFDLEWKPRKSWLGLKATWDASQTEYPFRNDSMNFETKKQLSFQIEPTSDALKGFKGDVKASMIQKRYVFKPESSSIAGNYTISVQPPKLGPLSFDLEFARTEKQYPYDPSGSYEQASSGIRLSYKGSLAKNLSAKGSPAGSSPAKDSLAKECATWNFALKTTVRNRNHPWAPLKNRRDSITGVDLSLKPAKPIEFSFSSDLHDRDVYEDPDAEYIRVAHSWKAIYHLTTHTKLAVTVADSDKSYHNVPASKETYKQSSINLGLSHKFSDSLEISLDYRTVRKLYPHAPSKSEEGHQIGVKMTSAIL